MNLLDLPSACPPVAIGILVALIMKQGVSLPTKSRTLFSSPTSAQAVIDITR